MILSRCHQAYANVDETNHYVCDACHKACDTFFSVLHGFLGIDHAHDFLTTKTKE